MNAEELAPRLLQHHRRFLRFLQAQTRDAAVAEELLQAAYAKSVQKAGSIRDDESAVAWFYRLLRRAVADHQRKLGRESKAIAAERSGEPEALGPDALRQAVCQCVGDLVTSLTKDQAQAVRRVDLEDATVPQLASELGITANNAGVRLHRARRALRDRVQKMCGACAAHGCLDCTCTRSPVRVSRPRRLPQ
jgi:RNA polymerase sigma-70 factor (ECF subfamily)